MTKSRVVLDTNVIVAALRSRHGASFGLVSLIGSGRFEAAVSVPLVFEYEDVLSRLTAEGLFLKEEIATFLDYICATAHRQEIFFLWRPQLSDPRDDMVLELAVAAGCDGIVTHNQRHFVGAEKFGVAIHSPREFLRLLEEAR
jgi:putative PIN family toxin of toxin-antitoxin system